MSLPGNTSGRAPGHPFHPGGAAHFDTVAPMPLDDLINRFKYHPAKTPERAAEHQSIRDAMKETAAMIVSTVPPGREQSLALTNLEQAMFWANAGVARQSDSS